MAKNLKFISELATIIPNIDSVANGIDLYINMPNGVRKNKILYKVYVDKNGNRIPGNIFVREKVVEILNNITIMIQNLTTDTNSLKNAYTNMNKYKSIILSNLAEIRKFNNTPTETVYLEGHVFATYIESVKSNLTTIRWDISTAYAYTKDFTAEKVESTVIKNIEEIKNAHANIDDEELARVRLQQNIDSYMDFVQTNMDFIGTLSLESVVTAIKTICDFYNV